MCPAQSKIYEIINIFRMIFVYHYIMIPLNSRFLPKYAPLILQSGGCQSRGCCWLRTIIFTLLMNYAWSTKFSLIVLLTPQYLLCHDWRTQCTRNKPFEVLRLIHAVHKHNRSWPEKIKFVEYILSWKCAVSVI